MITPDATYQQTKRVVSSVASTYQTVLTIDPSVGRSSFAGVYSCTVENVRGESSETVVVGDSGELIPYMHYLSGNVSIATVS